MLNLTTYSRVLLCRVRKRVSRAGSVWYSVVELKYCKTCCML